MSRETQDEIAATPYPADVEIGSAMLLAGAEQWVQIFPAEKEWRGADGRGPYRLTNPAAVVAASMKPEHIRFAMIDREHARQLAAAGTDVPAAGWFQEYQVREDGSIWGRAEWTRRGAGELANREYRYFSPTFTIEKATGEVLVITGGSLTNTPNFQQLQALASARRPESTQNPPRNPKETDTMNPTLIALAKAFGLDPEKATEAEILAVAQVNTALLGEMQAELAALKKDLGLKAEAGLDEVTAAVKKSAGGKVDPEKFVPKAMYDELASRMDTLEKSGAARAAEEAVEAAMKDGKIAPAQKEWALDYAAQNLEGFRKFAGAAPKIVEGESAAAQRRAEANGGLSDAEVEVARQLGLKPDALKKKEGDGDGKAAA